MSTPLNFAEALKAILEARPALATTPVIVEKQQDLNSAIQSAVAKMGTCILLYSASGKRPVKSCPGDPFDTAIVIEIYSKPILRGSTTITGEAAMAEVILAVDGWSHPGDVSGNAFGKTVVLAWELVPDPDYLVYRVTANQSLFF